MQAYFGLLGPLLFFITAFFVAAISPDYNAQTQMISELGASGSSHAWLFNYFGFLPNGIFITAFGVYFYAQLKQHMFKPLPAILIIIHGLGMLLATWFSCDLSCTPVEPSAKQIAHNILGAIKFPALHLSLLIFAIQLFKRGNNKLWAYASLFTFMLSAVLMVLFASSVETREYTGIYQRFFIGTLYLWLALISLNLNTIMARQRSKSSE